LCSQNACQVLAVCRHPRRTASPNHNRQRLGVAARDVEIELVSGGSRWIGGRVIEVGVGWSGTWRSRSVLSGYAASAYDDAQNSTTGRNSPPRFTCLPVLNQTRNASQALQDTRLATS
jgi:hypothetical protein